MIKLHSMITTSLALLLILSASATSHAQGLISKTEGSRPGQTYVEGQTAPAPDAAAQQGAPAVYPARQPASPVLPNVPQRPTLAKPDSSPNVGTPVILEFSDLQCPDSARFSTGLKKTIIQRCVATDRAEYQWHDFPLPVHDKAIEAAAAARCAGAAADTVRQKIMANQAQMNPTRYAQYAQEAGVNPIEFANCTRSNRHRDDVLRDKALGQSFGVKGTPTLVLGIMRKNGQIRPMKVIKAYDPPQQVLAEIDQWLAGIKPQQEKAQQ